jgi:hypothetical protein
VATILDFAITGLVKSIPKSSNELLDPQNMGEVALDFGILCTSYLESEIHAFEVDYVAAIMDNPLPVCLVIKYRIRPCGMLDFQSIMDSPWNLRFVDCRLAFLHFRFGRRLFPQAPLDYWTTEAGKLSDIVSGSRDAAAFI